MSILMFFGYRKIQSLQTFAAKIPQTFSVKNFLALVIKKSGMENGATLKNISQVLNLSISTVSRALKNHPDISEQTKRKVQETALMLDYEPNTFAINLRKNKRNLIGVIIPSLSNFFYQSFISALEEEAKKNDYSLLILQSADDPENELENLRICRANRVAVIFVSISPATVNIGSFLKLSQSATRVIFLIRYRDTKPVIKFAAMTPALLK